MKLSVWTIVFTGNPVTSFDTISSSSMICFNRLKFPLVIGVFVSSLFRMMRCLNFPKSMRTFRSIKSLGISWPKMYMLMKFEWEKEFMMKEKNLVRIELFNKRIDALYKQVCGWLEEENIEFDKKESGLTLTEAPGGPYETKRLDIFTKDNEKLFSIVPYGIWIIGAEGRVALAGESGEESLVYLSAGGPSIISKEIEGEKENIIHRKLNGSIKEGWHWLDEQIIGKKPLLTNDIFFALLERIN